MLLHHNPGGSVRKKKKEFPTRPIAETRGTSIWINTLTVLDTCFRFQSSDDWWISSLSLSFSIESPYMQKDLRHPARARKERNRWKGNHAFNKNEMVSETGLFSCITGYAIARAQCATSALSHMVFGRSRKKIRFFPSGWTLLRRQAEKMHGSV